jgi:membrane-bound lytic murein transglycosylase D
VGKAQEQQQPVAKAPMRVVSKDTIVISRPQPSAPIAANLPATPPERKPVPLAGHKTYFGAMNDYVNTYVTKYLTAHNKTLSVVQTRSEKHFSLIEEILANHNIPKELKYLAVIESALNNKAVSRAGAVGPWQLMAPTARMMGLHVNSRRDDRTDWYKATTAAAKYLSILYDQLNDWLLVVAAYNSGPTPVLRAMQKTGSNSFWDIKKYLPRETQGHVLAFIATASIFENMSRFIGQQLPADFDPERHGKPVPAEKPRFTPEELSNMAIVRIKDPISLDFMAQELGIDKKLLYDWNDDYELFLTGTYAEPQYSLRLPKEKLEKFLEKKTYITTRSKKILDEIAL